MARQYCLASCRSLGHLPRTSVLLGKPRFTTGSYLYPSIIRGMFFVMEFAVIKSRSKPIQKDLPPILGVKAVWDFSSIVIPKRLRTKDKYFAIEVLSPDQIDKSEFHSLPTDSTATVGILASSFFPIWVRAISDRSITIGDESANSYNNFPFPDLTKAQRKALEDKVGNIFQARSVCSFNKLSDLYNQDQLPEHLLMAHEDLDEVLLEIFGLPQEASNEEILEALMSRYAGMVK